MRGKYFVCIFGICFPLVILASIIDMRTEAKWGNHTISGEEMGPETSEKLAGPTNYHRNYLQDQARGAQSLDPSSNNTMCVYIYACA